MSAWTALGIRGAALSALVLAVAACPKELPRDATPDELYQLGRQEFERRSYGNAIEALQRFIFQDPGHTKTDSAQYMISESYYQQRQFITAANEFLRLAQNRPAGALADDSRYRACESYYQLSPRPELDQEFTQEAIDQCRSVVLLYPSSPYAAKANERIGELVDKLARKQYLNALYYYKRKAYDSAIVYLEYLLVTYGGSTVEPEAMLTLYESYTRVGYAEDAEEIKTRLIREYPDSRQAREVEKKASSEAE